MILMHRKKTERGNNNFIMNKYKVVLKCCGFIIGLVIILGCCDFAFAQSGYIQFILYEVAHPESNYDTIVLGDSHTRAGIDPQKLDDVMGTNTLNLGIPNGTVKDSYYILQEACRNNKVKRVILDVDYQFWVNPQGEGFFREPFIFNQMSWTSPTKWKYIFDNMDVLDVRSAFTCRNSYQFGLSNTISNIKFKNSQTYKTKDIYGITVKDANGPYVGKGFFYRNVNGSQPGGYAYLKSWYGRENMGISNLALSEFKKIKQLCDENGIELIAVTTPITPSAMQLLNIQNAEKSLTEVFDKYGITYFDFNTARMDVLPRTDTDYGDMEGHMGGRIGQEYSEVLAQVLSEYENSSLDVDKYFYSSYEEMYQKMDEDYTNTQNTTEGTEE